jgi:23S rRNA (uracil1939-C5)-methyltransferase
MLIRDAEVMLEIQKPAAGGRMIARHEGQVVLVSGAIPGERVRARVERAERSLAYATVVDVIDASPDRRPVRTDPACGGNLFAHVAYPRQLTLKREILQDAFTRIGHLPLAGEIAVAESPEAGYRMRARLHVREQALGFFREGSHDLCDAARTGQLLPETAALLPVLALRLKQLGAVAVTAIDLAENRGADERVLHLELRAGPGVRTTTYTSLGGLTGVSGATARLSTGASIARLGGTPTVSDPVDDLVEPPAASGLKLTRHATAFFQGNRYLLPQLVRAVLAWTPPEGPVLDLYAGVGLFALALAASGRASITAVEGDRASGADLRSNAAQVPDRVAAVVGSVEEYLQRVQTTRPSAVLVDPPRTGLSREVVDALIGRRAPRLIYVSCDAATLARDAARFVEAGYRMRHVEAFDLFPNTPHVESLAVFDDTKA